MVSFGLQKLSVGTGGAPPPSLILQKCVSVSIRLLTVKNNSHTDLRTSLAQLLEKGCQYREEDYENKIVIKRAHHR